MDGLLQLINLLTLRLMNSVELLYLSIHALQFFRQQAQPFVDQAKFQASEVGPKTSPDTPANHRPQPPATVAAAVRNQGVSNSTCCWVFSTA